MIRNSFILSILLLIAISCRPEDRIVCTNFGLPTWFSSEKTYSEEESIPFLGDGYRFIQYTIPTQVMAKIEIDSCNLFDKGFKRIEAPLHLQDLYPINLNETIQMGYILDIEHENRENIFVIIDIDNKRINCLQVFD